jgi:hypothetical protein
MLPTEDLFVYCYTLVDDLILDGQVMIPARPGPSPGCSDSEILTIVLVRHLLHRRSESGFLVEITRDHPGLFPRLPHHSEFNRRARWLWGATWAPGWSGRGRSCQPRSTSVIWSPV